MLEIYKKVLTTQGSALHAKNLAGGKIEFTKFAIGNGVYSGTESTESLQARTALLSPKNEYGITSVEVVNTATCKLTLAATNIDITEGYYITEIGVYAKGEDGNEVLYSIAVAKPDKTDWFPAYNNEVPGSIRYYDYISVGNSATVTLSVGAGGVALQEDLDALTTRVATAESSLLVFNNVFNLDNAGAHNRIFRGKYLGNAVTDTQSANIQNGTFKDMYLGDYWTINNVDYVIAGFDVFYNCGDTVSLGHNIVIVPRNNMVNGTGDVNTSKTLMNSTNTTDGGYLGSLMYTTNLVPVRETIATAFGNHLYSHRELLSNAVTDRKASGWTWVDATVELMSEVMVYGSTIWADSSTGGAGGYNEGIGNTQLPLFAIAPEFIHIRQNYWLRDVVSAFYFAGVDYDGYASYDSASHPGLGIRPFFLIH